MDIVKEITNSTNALPFDLQREVLDFVEFISHKHNAAKPRSFKSVRGILKHRAWDDLESDLKEIRREMWGDFPREEPK